MSNRLHEPLETSPRRYLQLRVVCCVFAFIVLGIGVFRSGHTIWTLSVNKTLPVIAVFLVFFGRRIRLFSEEMIVFLLVGCLELPVQWAAYEHFGVRSAAVGVFTLAMMLIVASLLLHRDLGDYYWKVVNTLALVSSWCLIIQVVAYSLGIRLDKIPVLSDTFFKAWEFTDKFRPCGPFSEPSHLAEFTLLSLYYCLFVKVNLKMAVVFTVAMIISTSGLGIVGAAMLIGLYIWNLDDSGRGGQIKKVMILLGGVLAVWCVYLWIRSSDHWLVERLLRGGTFVVRTVRSFELFGRFDTFEKFFGIGIQNQEIYLNYYWITLSSDTLQDVRQNREFAQALGYIVCTMGLMGLLPFLLAFVKLAIKYDYRIKSLVLLFLYICFTCCIFSRFIFLVYIVMIYTTVDMIVAQREETGEEAAGEKT